MKTNKTKSAMTALVIAAMLCTAAMPVKAADSQWVKTDGTWSYVKEDGSKATGWIKDGGCWYAFDADGAMRTGWIASNEHWYFMGESGVMQSDAWVEDNGAKYYIKGTGVMAKDYVKDGYELTSDGKAIPLGESGSVVVTDPAELEGKVIEGNLYVDVTTAKELELKGVTVKGKLVVLGDNETAGKVTLTDSKVETINTQTRNAEVVLSGKTEVKNVVIEETAKVTPDKNYKGEVENIEVQSTTKGEVVIDVPAENVSTRTYATVDVKAPVGNLEVKTDTQVKVNADVKNVIVTETAKDTTVEVSKGNTVGTITADAPVKIDGKGTVDKVEANVDGVEAGKDTTIKDVETGKDVTEAPDVNKPSNGGGSSSGGSGGGSTPSVDKTVAEVNSETELREALKDGSIKTITLNADMILSKSDNGATVKALIIDEGRVVTVDLNGHSITAPEDIANCYMIGNYGDLTIKDSSASQIGKIAGYYNANNANDTNTKNVRVVFNEGEFELQSGTLEGNYGIDNGNDKETTGSRTTVMSGGTINSAFAGITGWNNAKVTIKDGVINSAWYVLSGNGTQSNCEFTINGGTLTSKEDTAIFVPSTKSVTITGGTITGLSVLDIRAGNAIITGGTLTATGNYVENPCKDGAGSVIDGSAIFVQSKVGYNNEGEINLEIGDGAIITSEHGKIVRVTGHSAGLGAKKVSITITDTSKVFTEDKYLNGLAVFVNGEEFPKEEEVPNNSEATVPTTEDANKKDGDVITDNLNEGSDSTQDTSSGTPSADEDLTDLTTKSDE